MITKVLTLDGGGSKGIYTIGVLKELEKNLGQRIGEYFDYIYGTSTGAIICGLLSIGKTVEEVEDIYLEMIPQIMRESKAKRRSQKLIHLGEKLLGDIRFDSLICDIGVIALNYDTLEPLIFKSSVEQAHGSTGSFVPGFGCKLLTAILASSAAYPIFEPVLVETKNKGDIKTIDGGFVANNPSLYASIDLTNARQYSDIKLLNIGTGEFTERHDGLKSRVINFFGVTRFFFMKAYTSSTNTNYLLQRLIYPDLETLRINDSYMDIATNMTEKEIKVLKSILQKGQLSYRDNESKLKVFLGY